VDKYQLNILLEHLGYWFTEDEQKEIVKWQIPAEEVARDLARRDLVFFARRYLSHYFTLPLAACHWQLFEDIEQAITNGVKDQLAEALPRGFGKSTVACIASPLWCIIGDGTVKNHKEPSLGSNLIPRKHYIFVIKDSFDQSRIELADLKREIEENELFRKDFGDFVGLQTWAASSIVTSNGVRIDSLGTGMKVRGRRHGPHRPDMIIGDDLENDRHVASEIQRKKVKSWWFRAVLKAGDVDCDFIVVNTILHRDSLQAYLQTLPDWMSRRWQALISHASNTDLWHEWEQIYKNLENENRRYDATDFYEANKDAMLEGTEVLWPERFPYVVLREMMLSERLGQTRVSSFSQEMQNNPVDPADQEFSTVDFWHWEILHGSEPYLVPDVVGEPVSLKSCVLYGACDPSLGKITGDFTALIDILVGPSGRMFVVHVDVTRYDPDEIIEAVVARATFWQDLGFNYIQYGVETVQFQRLLAGLVASAALKSGVRLPIVNLDSKKNKMIRISSLVPDLKNGALLLYKDPVNAKPSKQLVLYDQLMDWPSVVYDDALDALEMARSLAAVRGAGTRTTGNVAGSPNSTVGHDPFLIGMAEESVLAEEWSF
jgi:predicted phage terminase large subunit-like protein